MTETLPAALRRALAADHRPVRPLAPPWRRALLLLPVGALSVAFAPYLWGFRANLAALGPGLAWGLSGAQVVLGLAVVGAALREAIPGRALSARAVAGALLASVALVGGITLATAARAPMAVPPDRWLRWIVECMGIDVVAGVPTLLGAGFLAARGWPNRPALAGALYGLGAGLVADSGMRLFCWVSDPVHVVLSHGGAMAALAGAGALIAVAVDRVRFRRVAS